MKKFLFGLLLGGLFLGGVTLAAPNILQVPQGGTSVSTTVKGSILYAASSTAFTNLNAGTAGQILSISDSLPAWTNTLASTTLFEGLVVFPSGFISQASSSIGSSLTVNGALNASSSFLTSSSTYLNVDGGNTYIGVLSPATPAKLIVRGSGGDVFSADSALGSRLFSLADSGTMTFAGALRVNSGQIYSGSATDGLLYTLNAGTTWVGFANAGNRVGFAVGGPAAGVMSQDFFQIRSHYNVAGGDILSVSSSGYVGINSSTPSSRLSVGGSAYIDGSLRVSDVTVTSTLTINGLTTFAGGFISQASSSVSAGLQVAGALNASGTLNVLGASVLGGATLIGNVAQTIGAGNQLFVQKSTDTTGQISKSDSSLPVQISTSNSAGNTEAYYAVNSGNAGTYGALFGMSENNVTFGDAVVVRSVQTNYSIQFIVDNSNRMLVMKNTGVGIAVGTGYNDGKLKFDSNGGITSSSTLIVGSSSTLNIVNVTSTVYVGGLATFSGGFISNASSTFNHTVNIGSATVTGTLFADLYPTFTYVTSSWSGTTTIPLGVPFIPEKFSAVQCFTDVGTVNVVFNDGTNKMDLLNASTTVGYFNLTTNNTFTAGTKRFVDVGTPASSPTKISCTVKKRPI